MQKLMTILVTFIALVLAANFAQAAPRDCKTLLTGECVGCHEKEKFCDNAGKTEKFWKAMIGLMQANGAEISKSEKADLIACLSEPSDSCTSACQ